MINKAEQFIKSHHLLSPGDKIVVAVSGGPDSTALLLLLDKLAPLYHWKLIMAHVNYHSRGADSERDEKFVRRLAKRLQAPVAVRSVRLNRPTKNFEARARDIRYEFFTAVAKKYRADKIAVAHTADDQAETMIQNMLRGSGLRGAAGMPVRRGLIVRPLLGLARAEILRWLRRQKQTYRTDHSNRDTKYQRNWIRWRLLPYLRRRDSDWGAHLDRAGKTFGRAAAWLERQASAQLRRLKIAEQDKATRYRLAPFLGLPELLQGEMIRSLLGKKDISRVHVAEVLAVLKSSPPGKAKEFRGISITKKRGYFECREKSLDGISGRC